MKNVTRAGVLLGLTALAATAHADWGPYKTDLQVADNPWYVSAMFDAVLDRDGRNSNDLDGGSIFVGKFLDQHFAVELGYFHEYGTRSVANGREWRENGAELSGLFYISRKWPIQPYAILSADYVHTTRPDEAVPADTPSNTGDNFAWAPGLGVLVPFRLLGIPIGLRFDARERFLRVGSQLLVNTDNSTTANTDGLFQEPFLRVGLTIPFPWKHVKAAPAPVAAPAPAPKPVAPPPPPAAPAEAHKLEDVHFPYNKSSLTDKARSSLDADVREINAQMKRNPGTNVEVAGHTDWIGSDAYNQALSERRAQSVKDYLVRKGIAGTKITTVGFGKSKPVADNRTDEGRALNRRAEIRTFEK